MRMTWLLVLALYTGQAFASGDDASEWLRDLVIERKDQKPGARIATNGDVFLAAALMTDDKNWRQDPAWAKRALQVRDYIRDEPKGGLTGPAHRGYAASIFSRLLEIEGGLWSQVFDQPARYAYRDLVVLGLIAPGGADVHLSTEELASLLIAAERYRKVGADRLPQRGITP